MDDVIFAGTDKRSALGRAEVSLTIDNSDGMVPIEFNEVTITRTLFRTGESEYAINNVPCRMLDIQELLSDAGVGRQQHVIISQGQIDAVLNAKPEERRLIIEEAAGVLKYRKRKEKSERRLASTETNLTRLQDLLREVRRQLRPLERQADAARRHGAVVDELTALRIYVAGRELESLQRQARRPARSAEAELERPRPGAQGAASPTSTPRCSPPRPGCRPWAATTSATTSPSSSPLFERSRGLASLLAERRRGIDRDRNAFVDQGVIFTLEAEAADLEAPAGRGRGRGRGAGARRPPQLAEAEAALVAERELFEKHWAEGVVAPSGHAAEVRGELAALRGSVERGENETARVTARLAGITDEDRAPSPSEAERLRGELAAAESPSCR